MVIKKAEYGTRILQDLLDALPHNTCLLDSSGNIELANRAWFIFAEANDANLKKVSPGCNYLDVCDYAEGEGKKKAKLFAAGIRSVLEGEESAFAEIYPCHTPDKKYWFLGRGAVFCSSVKAAGRKVLIMHEDITERVQAKNALQERVKELTCLQEISKLSITGELSAEELFRRIVNTIPSYWQYPEIACARITFYGETEDKVHISNNFRETSWSLKSELPALNEIIGQVEVFYLENVAPGDEDLFLKEEQLLLGSIANLLANIALQKKSEQALVNSEMKFKAYVNKAPVGVFIIDRDGKYLEVNPEACRMSGYTREEMLGLTVNDFIAPQAASEGMEHYNRLMVDGHAEKSIMARRKDGSLYWIYLSAAKIAENRYIGYASNITPLKEAEQSLQESETHLRYLSFHDPLTGLYNRAYLDEEIWRLDTGRQLPITIVMGDLNGLKLINDTYGHLVGDSLLKRAARIITASCRKEDIIVRWGGDEFVVLMPQTSAQEAQVIIKRIKNNCLHACIEEVPVSISLGFSTSISKDTGLYTIMREAENEMYKQKLTESRSTKNAVLASLLSALSVKSFETKEHTRGMQEMAQKIGVKMNLPDSELSRLDLLISLHDIGKIKIDGKILAKKGPLTEGEWEVVKQHPEIGYRIASATEEFAHVASAILSHHERWDGLGYPQGLKGEEIPLLARITSVADAFEVMSNGRPYKKALSKNEIVAEFKRCSGTQFDPQLVEILFTLLP